MELHEVRNVSVSIARAPADVHAFLTDGANLPRWASGLGSAVRRDGDAWLAEGPLGAVRVRFAPRNPFGVADHAVTLPTGATVHNPVRVLPNGDGSTVVFTILGLPGVSQAQLEEDARTVEKDLRTLKAILEGTGR